MDRCIRLAAGQEIPDRERVTIPDAYHHCWIAYHGPFKVLYSDGEGALNNETPKAMMAKKGTTLRVRAPGQRATSIESSNGILRGTLHMLGEELNRHNSPIVFTRVLAESIYVTNAFTFYNGVS
eukprot:4731493-Pyramimonas_sp.AAC.1